MAVSPRTLLRGTSALTAAAVMASAGWALATPTGGTVVSGSATITQTDPKTIVIRQESDKVIIEWENFDIGKGEHVVFDQPSSLAAALNRVLGGGKTAILGSLTANGRIIITNPKGIVFGPDARVDVASIIATSLGISNANFLSGRMIFDQPGEPGAVVSNAGEITVKEGGLAALVAPGVENSGVIRARLGTVALAAGNAATLDLYGDGLVQLAITAPVKDVPIGPDGQPVKALVRQAGQIFADGGTVVLTAEAAEGVIDRIINVEGIVQARSIEQHDGQIAFVGGGGEVRVAGTVDARGQGDGVTGGTVHVLGDAVTLADNASIDASGAKGGGTVLIGGDAHGGPLVRTAGLGYEAPAAGGEGGATVVLSKDVATTGYIPTADITYIEAGAVVAADATAAGDGGKVVAWSDGTTSFAGAISARGGSAGGNGGFVEISGLGDLTYRGTVDTRAPVGAWGTLLLDPTELHIFDGADNTSTGNQLADADLISTLATSNVTLSTQAGLGAAQGTGSGPGHITFDTDADVTWTSGADLTVVASNDTGANPQEGTITVADGVTIHGTGSATDRANITFTAGTVDLSSDIQLDGTLSGSATTVNVFDPVGASVGSIQDAIDIAAVNATIEVHDGTYVENVVIDKALTLQGSVDASTNDPTTILAPNSGIGIKIQGPGFVATDDVTIENLVFQGNNTLGTGTGYGIWVDPSAQFDTLTVRNGRFSGWVTDAFYEEGDSATGRGVAKTILSDLHFESNGRSSTNAGTGDISFWNWNGDAELTDLTLVGSWDGADSFEHSAIQFRGVGAGNGTGVLSSGTVTLSNVDISGTYQTQMIGIQRYTDVSGFSFSGVKLGGDSSGIMGTFGAALRFDAVGDKTASSTIDLGDTWFRGLGAAGSLSNDIEFAPDNTFAFLTADATGTKWFDTETAAANLTLDQLFQVEDRTLHVLDAPQGGQLAKGLAVVRDQNLYVTQNSGSIQRGVDAAGAGWTVNVDNGTYVESVVIDKALTLLGAQQGVAAAARDDGHFSDESQIEAPDGTTAINIGASDVTIDGFTVSSQHDGAGSYGIAETGPWSGTKILNNHVTGMGGVGIAIAAGSSGAEVTGNLLEDAYAGIYLATGAHDLQVLQNTVRNLAAGAGPDQGAAVVFEGNNTGVLVSQNVFSGNATGVYVWSGFGTDFTGTRISDNSFVSNAKLVTNTNTSTIDASGNWWGTTDEGTIAAAMEGSVDFTPYLGSGDDQDTTTAGFQGDFHTLHVTTKGAQTGTTGRIQEGIDSVSGSKVIVDPGIYTETVHIDVPVELVGLLNESIDPTDTTATRGAESIIVGGIQVDALGGPVAIAGLTIQDGATIQGEKAGVYLVGGASGVTIENTIFSGSGGSDGFRAILASTGGVTNVHISNNLFTGWATGVYLNPGADDVTLQANVFDGNNVGVSVDGPLGTNGVNITGNTFKNSAFEGLGLGLASPAGLTVSSNSFSGNAVHIGVYGSGWAPDTFVATATGNTFDRWVTISAGLPGGRQAGSVYSTIQQAVNEAAAAATVEAGAFTFVENVVIDKALTLKGQGATSTQLKPTSGTAILVDGITGFTGGVTIDVTIDGFGLDGGGTAEFGVHVTETAEADSVTLQNSKVSNFFENGFALYGATTTGSPVDSVSILDTTFENNGRSSGSSGRGDIVFFRYNGGITLTGVTVRNYTADGGGNGRYGIQLRGVDDGTFGSGAQPMGTVAFTNVTVEGNYAGPLVGIQGFSNIDGLSFSGVTIGSATSSSGWGTGLYLASVNIDGGDHVFDLKDTAFFKGTGIDTYIEAVDGTGAGDHNKGLVILAGDATFDSVLGSAHTNTATPSGFDLEDRIFHVLDGGIGSGLVTWIDNTLFVTPASGSIQRAVDAAPDHGTIYIDDGTFRENVSVYKPLTIIGKTDPTTLDGSGLGGSGFDITADDVSLSGVIIQNFTYGVNVGTEVENLSLTEILAQYNTAGLHVADDGGIDRLTVTDSHFDDNTFGWYLSKGDNDPTNLTTVTNVTVSGTSFSNNLQKGLYAEKLDHATFTGITVENSGTDSTYTNNAGIDINLKNGTYADITFDGVTVTGSGLDGTSGGRGTAFTVKARNDGVYASTPATLTGLGITNATITAGGSVALALGNNIDGGSVTDSTITGPEAVLLYDGVSGVTIGGNTITANALSGLGLNYGVGIVGSPRNTVKDNRIEAELIGVLVSGSDDTTIGGPAWSDGNTIEGGTGVEVQGGTGLVIAHNHDISGGTDGILFSTPFTATAEIAFNHDIHGRRGDGIHFADGLDGAEVDIIGNRKIEGGDDGIDVHGLVEGGAALDIAWNWHIEGRDGDGIVLRGVDGWRTSVDISHNLKIEGEDNGIHLAAPRDLRAFFDGGAWAIDGASVSIADNATIVGRHDDGIRVEGVRGNGSGRTTNLAITGNGGFWPWQGIFGKDNGIAITRVLYGTWTACDCYEGTVGLSGWAVENAKVVIAGNSLIEGKHDDGILIQGVHATKGDDAPWWWTPEASVEINGNGTILGKDNGIAVTRGFDLVADDGWIGWNDGNLIGAVKNAPDFSDGLLKALHHFGEDDAVTLSAWAIENASVEIAGNGLVKGRNENGILVEGIHSTAWQKFCDVGPWSQTGNASLLIAGNGWGHGWNGIIGGDNGIRLARGVDLRFDGWYGGQELELGAWAVQNATATIVGNALVKGEHGDGILVEGVQRDAWSHGHGDDADLLIAGNREISGKWDGIHLGWGVDLARTDYESLRWEGIWLSAWAIDSISGTSVVVAHNDDIEGKRGDGILVEGVWADPKGHQFGDNLLIADNGTIKGGWDGIALTRGFDLSGEGWLSGHLIRKVFDSAADHDALLGELGFKPGLDLTAWAILYGRVSIDDNDRIEGKGGDGIFVKGVRGTGFEWQPNLAITGNGGWWPWQGIFGKHDGIHIDSVLYDTWVDCGCYERGTPGLSAWAVENAKVLIAGNSLIKGERDDGIRIEGVHATEAGDRFDDEYGGFGFGWLTPSASVSIKDNKTILGKDNGIAITRGFDLKADDGWIGWKDWKLIWAVTGGTDVAHDLGKALFKAFDKTDVTLSAWAIENADVAITGNGLIKGHDDNGILVEGIHSTAWQKLCDVYPWSQTGDAELLIAGNGRTLGHDGGDDVVTAAFAGGGDHGIGGGGKGIIGGDNGIRIARGIDLYLGTVEYESTSLDLGAWGIQDAVVKIVGNGLIQGEDRNGIEVDGIKDGGTQGFSLFGFADCCGTDRLNLAILGNGTIQGGEGEDRLEGGENGIEIGRGLDLHLAEPSFGGPTRSLASETTTFGLGGEFSPLGLLGLGGLTLDVTAVAIDGGHVLIDSNDRIAGGGANGILVEGMRDTGPDCFCGDEGSLWNLDITRNQLVWGAENGILLDRGYGLSVGVALSGHESFAIAALTPGITASGWAIDDATVRIAGNTAIWGGSEDGIQVRGVRGTPNGLDDGTQDADQQNDGDPLAYDAPKPNLLILANTDIEGGRSLDGFETRGRDGIHLGTGFDFDFDFEPGLLTALVTSGSPFGGVTEASVNGGSVVIDLNGHAKHTATGADYAPASDQVVLGDYTFDGVIRGTDDGIEVEGDIGLGAGVFIRRNMVVGSGDTGIVFASIGQTGADYLDKVCEGVDVSTSVTVLNNFILANGQALIDDDTENDSGVEGDGIHFTGAIGAPEEVRTAIKIFQNFIAQNQTDGVHVDEAAGDGASLIALNQNFVPAGVSPDPDRNGRFGLLNQATGAIDADANWWGTADPSLINTLTIGFFANGPVTLASILSSGLDSNLEIDPGRTEFDNFAFQAAAAIGLPVPPPGFTPPTFVFDPTLIRFTPPNLGVPPDTPGDAWYRWSAVNLQFPTNPLGGPYSLGGTGGQQGLEAIAPAAGPGAGQGPDDCGNQFLGDMNASCVQQP